MKTPTLILTCALLAAPTTHGQAPPTPPVVEEENTLSVNPSQDLFDYATLNYNSALTEKDPKKRAQSYRIAARSFDRFIRAFPQDPKALESWYFLAMAYREIGEENEKKASRTCFETIVKTWDTGKYVEASALYLASDDYQAEKWSSAAQWFQIVAKTTKTPQVRHESLYRRFLCFHKLDDKANILLSLKAVLADEGNPFQEKARLSLAQLYQNSQSHREAHNLYVILATSKDPKIRADATLQAALTARELKDPKLTKTWFRKVLDQPELKDLRGKTQLALMNLHYQDKEWTEVISTFNAGNFTLEKEEETQKFIIAAKAYEALDQPNQVLKLYEKISRLSPGTATSYQAAYRLLVRDHQQKSPTFSQSAEAFLKNYAPENPKDPKIHSARLLLAEHYYAQKDYQKALTHYRELQLPLVDTTNHLAVRFHVAKSQLALKNHDGALLAIAAFLQEFPKTPQANQLRLDRAELLTSLKREPEALADYQSILNQTTDPSLKRNILARLAAHAQEQKDWPTFAAYQEKILQLPNLEPKAKATAHFWIGWNHYRLKNLPEALPNLRTAREIDPKTYAPQVGPLLIRAAFQAEDDELLEKEINLLRQADSKAELPVPIIRWLGATLAKAGHFSRAWPLLHEGLSTSNNPASPLIWKLYTQTALATNHPNEALNAANSLLELEKNPYLRAEALSLKAQAHLALGQFDDARQATSDALKLRPQGELDYSLRILAGDIDIAEDKPGDAIRHYSLVDNLYAKTPEQKKEARQKVTDTLKAIGTPEALETLKSYQ